MKALTTAGLTKLIQIIKSTFIKNTDVIETTTLGIDTAVTTGSSNLITSNGVASYHDSTKYDATNPNGYTSNVGTITGITMNGSSKGTSGVVNLGTVITDVSDKQDTLVSGTNIKTINSTSILGSGDIEIKSAPDLDNKTISKNSSEELQAIGVIDSSDNTTALKTWTGDEEGYDAIETKDTSTLYNVIGKGVYLGTQRISTNYHPPLLSCMWSDHIINEISFLRADTFSWQSGDVYVTAYNKLVEEYSTGSEETEGSITFKRTTNGFKIADASMESAILSKYNSDGIAWYYILDTTNKQFKLPRTKFGFEGLRDNVGDDIAESLPNITGNILTYGYTAWSDKSTGAFSTSSSTGTLTMGSSQSGVTGSSAWVFDASGSSSAYQDGAPVQERATQMYLYFYVGEYSQTAIEQTAGITTEQLNNKLDVSTYNANPRETAVYLKTTYVNGTSGYNIWSDGYCEQWGYISLPSSGTVITLTKTYANTNYNLVGMYGGTVPREQMGICEITTSSTFTLYHSAGLNSSFCLRWKTSGYLAEGEY